MTADRQAGFNLVELMITIAIAAILLTLAVPSFSDFFDKYRLRGAADDIVSTLANARAAAVKADRDVNITFKGATDNWCMGASAAVEPTGGAPVGAPDLCDCESTAADVCVVAGQRLAINQGKHKGVAISALPKPFVFDSKMGLIDPMGSSEAELTSPAGKYMVKVKTNPLGQSFICVPSPLPEGKRAIAGVPSC